MTRSSLAAALALPLLWAAPAAAQAAKYQVARPAQAGALAGTVTLEGTAPAPKRFLINKNKEVCGTGRKEVPTIALSGSAIDEVVVYLEKVASGKDWPKGPHVLDQETCEFHPHVMAMPVNEELVIVNSDAAIHNTHAYHSANDKGGITVINLAMPTQGMKIPRKMTRAGMHRVDCDAHNWMRAWIYVGANPYYAVTAKGGKYRMDDIPAGTYTVVLWQEALGEHKQQVTIDPGRTTTLDFVMQGR